MLVLPAMLAPPGTHPTVFQPAFRRRSWFSPSCCSVSTKSTSWSSRACRRPTWARPNPHPRSVASRSSVTSSWSQLAITLTLASFAFVAGTSLLILPTVSWLSQGWRSRPRPMPMMPAAAHCMVLPHPRNLFSGNCSSKYHMKFMKLKTHIQSKHSCTRLQQPAQDQLSWTLAWVIGTSSAQVPKCILKTGTYRKDRGGARGQPLIHAACHVSSSAS